MGGLVTWKALAGLLFLTVNVQSQDFYENFEESLLNEGNRSFFAEIIKTRYHFLHCSPYDLECLFNPVVSIGHSGALFSSFVYSGA